MKHERGEGWGEGFPSEANNPPLPGPLLPLVGLVFTHKSYALGLIQGQCAERIARSYGSATCPSRTARRAPVVAGMFPGFPCQR